MPLLGWRIWSVDKMGILSGAYGVNWYAVSKTAQCDREEHHRSQAPVASCKCGIYSVKTLLEAQILYKGLMPSLAEFGQFFSLLFIVGKGFIKAHISGVLIADFYRLMWKNVIWPDFKRLFQKFYSNPDTVLGIVALSGRNLIYEEVIRSENARIVCLYGQHISESTREKISQRYAVPFFSDLIQAQNYATESGEWIASK